MNPDLSVTTEIGKRQMRVDSRQLIQDSLKILRRFEPIALVAAVGAMLLFAFALGLNPIVAFVLGSAFYPGVALILSRPTLDPHVDALPTPEEEAFQRMRGSTAHVLALAQDVESPEIRERVVHIAETFKAMIDVMDKDKNVTNFASAPEYEVDIVGPFEKKLEYYVLLSERRVALAAPQIAQFEEDELRHYEALTKSFYQHYHDRAVMDFAALIEIFHDWDENDETETNTKDEFDTDADTEEERNP